MTHARRLRAHLFFAWAVAAACSIAGQSAAQVQTSPLATGSTLEVLHSFHGDDGQAPDSTPALDSMGRIYGTTYAGGGKGYAGVLFRWSQEEFTILHRFKPPLAGPSGALLIDAADNVYGTAYGGVAFKASQDGTFRSVALQGTPRSGLIAAPDGRFYGTTSTGGRFGKGSVFSIDPTFTEAKKIHAFRHDRHGYYPYAPVTWYGGRLYGTTQENGVMSPGAIYSLLPDGSGFTSTEVARGALPQSGLTADGQGVLWGTVSSNISQGDQWQGCGWVYRYLPESREFQEIHKQGNRTGCSPSGELTLAQDGKLYGTTYAGGRHLMGTIFRIDPVTLVYETLHSFAGRDGKNPQRGLVQDASGAFYGTTRGGGPAGGSGVLFRFIP